MATKRYLPVALVFVAVITAAMNLRAGIAGLGPVLGDVLASFNASGNLAGIITAMPGAFFAVMGLSAVPIARRVGLSRTLWLGMAMTLIGTAFRPWVNSAWPFMALTAFVVAGIALSNVLLPAWIKLHGGRNIVTLMTLNTTLLGASGAVGPLSALFVDGDDGWRHALFFWVWIAIAQVAVWAIVALRTGFDFPDSAQQPEAEPGKKKRRPASLFSSPTAIFLMVFFGLQSMNAYIQMGFLPQILIDAGTSQAKASIALAVVGAMNILGGIVMPPLIDKVASLAPYILAIAGFAVIGYLGILLAPTSGTLIWSAILGLGGWAFPGALALIVARSREPEVTARLSGFVQPVGYLFPMVGPLIVGAVYTPQAPNWAGIIIALIIASVIQGLVGARAARRFFVDDELARR
ncbi:MFS transporter [Corynebacterium yudongzhengii]|nr:MFS transporter [Corynebacterium yudongzhengii]